MSTIAWRILGKGSNCSSVPGGKFTSFAARNSDSRVECGLACAAGCNDAGIAVNHAPDSFVIPFAQTADGSVAWFRCCLPAFGMARVLWQQPATQLTPPGLPDLSEKGEPFIFDQNIGFSLDVLTICGKTGVCTSVLILGFCRNRGICGENRRIVVAS